MHLTSNSFPFNASAIYLHRVWKKDPPSTCYNLDIHDLTTITFRRNVTEKVRNHMMLRFSTATISCFCITLRNRKPRRQHTGVLCVQHSPTSAAISTSFLLNHVPNSSELNALITRSRESHSNVIMSRESKRLKKSSSWLNSGNALIQHFREKCNFRVSSFYQVVQKHMLWDVA